MNRKERRAAEKRRDKAPKVAAGRLQSGAVADLMAEARQYYQHGRIAQAQDVCHQILESEPSHVQSLNLLGIIAQGSSSHRLAIKWFAKALTLDALNAACHYNIATSYQALDRRAEAIAHFKKALAFGMNNKTVEEFIIQSPIIARFLDRISKQWPLPVANEELFGAAGVAPVATDLLLLSAMETTALKNAALEVLLVKVRSKLLRLAHTGVSDSRQTDDTIVGFFCALAQQCFLNEYVFAQSDEEARIAMELRDLLLQNLQAGRNITPLMLAAVAAYFPLYRLPLAESLLRKQWPESVAGLLQQQLREPLEEASDRNGIPALTDITDSVTLQVRQQYEENPYPRWTTNPLAAFAVDQAQGKTGDTGKRHGELEILVAGCGTGLHPIQVAQIFPDANVLAFDISLASLAYARRKTRELGLHNIEYAQADILNLRTIGRTFDHIEVVGVLHHLAEPKTGWRELIALLRPDGEMRVGLYSETARRAVVEARALIAAHGYGATDDDIRKCRQDIMRDGNNRHSNLLINSSDFYSMSGCRDLLFNVMEHRFTIPEIAEFLNDNDLSFLGFEFSDDPSVIEKFQQRFPGPSALTNLDLWHAFELANPQTFWGMYVSLLRKNKN